MPTHAHTHHPHPKHGSNLSDLLVTVLIKLKISHLFAAAAQLPLQVQRFPHCFPCIAWLVACVITRHDERLWQYQKLTSTPSTIKKSGEWRAPLTSYNVRFFTHDCKREHLLKLSLMSNYWRIYAKSRKQANSHISF